MCQGLFFNKVAGVKPIKKETLEQVHSSCKFCQISKNTSGRLLPLKRRLVGGGISISFCYQWEWVNQFVIREDRNVAISGGKIILRSCKAKKKNSFFRKCGRPQFFLSILRRYSIFFFSFFRFFLHCFWLVCLVFEIKNIYSDTHSTIRAGEWQKKFYPAPYDYYNHSAFISNGRVFRHSKIQKQPPEVLCKKRCP